MVYLTLFPMLLAHCHLLLKSSLFMVKLCLLVLSTEWGNGITLNSYYGSFPDSLLSTRKCKVHVCKTSTPAILP